jgi:hypothetical protein
LAKADAVFAGFSVNSVGLTSLASVARSTFCVPSASMTKTSSSDSAAVVRPKSSGGPVGGGLYSPPTLRSPVLSKYRSVSVVYATTPSAGSWPTRLLTASAGAGTPSM